MGRGLAPFPDRRALFREGARAKHLDRDKSRPTEVEVLFSINGSLLLPCLLAFRLTKSPNYLIHNLKYSTVGTIRCATKKTALPSIGQSLLSVQRTDSPDGDSSEGADSSAE